MKDQSETAGCRKSKRRRWIVWLVLLLAACGWAGRFAYLRITRRPTPRPEYWQAKLDELDPPPSGAVAASEARAAIRNRTWEKQCCDDRLDVLRGPWDESRKDITDATELFESDVFRDSRRQFARVVTAGWHEAPQPLQRWYPMSYEYSSWNDWLMAHARWQRKYVRNMVACVEEWTIALRLIRQLRRCHEFAGDWAAVWHCFLMTDEMIRTTLEGDIALDSRSFAATALDLVGPIRKPSELFEAHKIRLQAAIENYYVRDGHGWMVVNEMVALHGGGWGRPSRLWNLLSPLFDDLQTASGKVDALFAPSHEITNLVKARRAMVKFDPSRNAQTLTILQGFPESVVGNDFSILTDVARYYQSRCQLDAALAMLALNEYRRAHGQFPDELDEIVPDYLPRLPIDYADFQPLRYRKDRDEYVLYSIGWDGVDDGGDCANHERVWHYGNRDVVFTVMHRPDVSE